MATIKLISEQIATPLADVVFIHGLWGDADATWEWVDSASGSDFKSFWPKDLADDLADPFCLRFGWPRFPQPRFPQCFLSDATRPTSGLFVYFHGKRLIVWKPTTNVVLRGITTPVRPKFEVA